MNTYSLAHLSDSALVAGTRSLVAQDRVTTSELLAHLAEVDARKLYLPDAYPSLYDWCVGHLGLSEDSAYKRIRAARAARVHPQIFAMVADGRLTLSAVVLLAPVLTTGNADELLAAAAGLSRGALERLIAERFPSTEMLTMVSAVGASVGSGTSTSVCATPTTERPDESVYKFSLAPGPVAPSVMHEERARMVPLAPGRFALTVTITQETHDALEYARSLLGHAVPGGDLAQVLDRALKALVAQLERQRFGKCARSRASVRRDTRDPRHIPAAVRRMVWERDGGQCTFTSDHGHRCESRTRLEFDHIEPVARGGESTPGNLRLRCRAHNQHAAERAFGRDFMAHQREHAQRARESARTANRSPHELERAHEVSSHSVRDDIVKALRNLGYSASEARDASRVVDTMPGAPLGRLLPAALKSLLPRSIKVERYGAGREGRADQTMTEASTMLG